MNKLFTKIAKLTLGLSMAVGVGVAVSAGRQNINPVSASSTLTFNTNKNTMGTTATSPLTLTDSTSGIVLTVAKGSGTNDPNPNNATYLRVQAKNTVTLSSTTGVTFTQIVMNASSSSYAKTWSASPTGVSVSDATITWSSTAGASTVTLTNTDSSQARITSVQVTYDVPKTLKSISVSTPPTKVIYTEGEYFNPAGLVITRTYSDNSTDTYAYAGHTSEFSFSPSTSTALTTSNTSVSITYNSKTTSQAITVNSASQPSLSVNPASISSYTGASFSVTATFANLTSAFAWGTPLSNDDGSIDGEVTTTTGTSTDGTSTYSGTLETAGHVTLSTSGGGIVTAPSVSFTITQTTVNITKTSTSIQQGGNETLAVTHNASSVGGLTWESSDLSGKISVNSDGKVTVANDATVGATATITATSQVDSSASDACTVTVSENPFAALTKVSSANDVTTDGVYALSHDGVRFVGNSISNKLLVYPITDYSNVGFFKINASGNLQLVTESNGTWSGGNSDYINNSSGTDLSKGEASSVWEAVDDEVDSVFQGVMFENTSNSNRFLGLGTSDVTTATGTKAYALSNLHTGNDNLPVYLYEVPQDTLQSLAISGAIPTYTAGSTFSFGRTATAHYSISGDVPVSSGLTFTLGGTSILAGDTIPANKVGTQAVVVTYTDSNSNSVSAAAYNVTVNYKGATDIELNLSEAGLSINGTVSLTATVSDEYADPNAVSWASDNTSIATVSAASGTKTITVKGIAAGNTTITATANGHSATCAISVTADPILNLLDDEENVINDQTLNHFTGDASVWIQAHSENVASPSYSWNNKDDSVVTIDASDYLCEVTIVGAGNSEVSVTVGSLTRTVTFSVSQSGVTAISLTSSVASGEIWDGTYENTLTLTPSVTKTGNATNVINWSSSDTDVATVSSPSTSGTAITVTGVGEGTATITARSAYTPATYAEYEVTVKGDGVESLSWTKRPKFNSGASGFQTIWGGETTLGDLMSQNGSDGIGVFAPTWKSSKSDSPTMGTGAHNVHIGLYDTGAPTEETTPLTSSYVFTAADNGKYVVAFYEGKASTNNTQLSVTKWRSVIETVESSGTYSFSGVSGSSEITNTSTFNGYFSSTELTAPTVTLTKVYQNSGAIRLGTGSASGSIVFDFGSVSVNSITIIAHGWSASEKACTMSITNGGTVVTTSESSSDTFDVDLSSATSKITFSVAKNNRICIESITFTAGGSQQIGKTEDCLGLESFIDTNLHMSDYTASAGWCNDEEHHYYSTAKAAYNSLNTHQKSLFVGNSAYAAEYARLSAWAAANGDSFNAQNSLASGRISPLVGITNSGNTVAIIVIISMVSVTAIGGYFFLRKRKEN